MRLVDLKGSYDGIYSLGDVCLAAIQLEKNGLRFYSGMLDWMGNPQLSEVNRMLMNRFTGFMELQNLSVLGDANEEMLLVLDKAYQSVSNHDFTKAQNTVTNLATYPEVKQKYDRRIQRFLEKADSCQRILFIRTEGSFQDAYDLQMILTGLVKHDFRILLVNHAPVNGIVELEWPLEKVCAVQLPNEEKWAGNDHLWKTMFTGINHS